MLLSQKFDQLVSLSVVYEKNAIVNGACMKYVNKAQ